MQEQCLVDALRGVLVGKGGNLVFCLPEASFLASQTEEGVRDERYCDQWVNLAFLMAEK